MIKSRCFLFGVTIYIFTAILSFSSCDSTNTQEFTLAVDITPLGSGTVEPANGSYQEGESIELIATPNYGYLFDSWSGDQTSNSNPVTIQINRDKRITANFVKTEFPLKLSVVGDGNVLETIVRSKSDEYEFETLVQLEAQPHTSWTFKEWTGDLIGTSRVETILMDSEKSISAVFEKSINLNLVGGSREESVRKLFSVDNRIFGLANVNSNDGDIPRTQDYNNVIFEINKFGEVQSYFVIEEDISINDINYHSNECLYLLGTISRQYGDFNSNEIVILKYDLNGNQLKKIAVTSNRIDSPDNFIILSNGDMLITGSTRSESFPNNSETFIQDAIGFIMRVNADGDILWFNTVETSKFGGLLSALELTSNKEIFVYGFSFSSDGDLSVLPNNSYPKGFILKFSNDENYTVKSVELNDNDQSTGFWLNDFIEHDGSILAPIGIYFETKDPQLEILEFNFEGEIMSRNTIEFRADFFGHAKFDNQNNSFWLIGQTNNGLQNYGYDPIGNSDIYYLNFDLNGGIKSVQFLGGVDNESLQSSVINNGYLISGGSTTSRIIDGMTVSGDSDILITQIKVSNK